MKPWIFYVILAWQLGPLAPEEQKTLILQFDSQKECQSVAEQVDLQVKQARSIFYLKEVTCVSCQSLYGKERCRGPEKKGPEKKGAEKKSPAKKNQEKAGKPPTKGP